MVMLWRMRWPMRSWARCAKAIWDFTFLARVNWLAGERGFHVVNADATIMLERPKLSEHIAAMRESLAETLNIDTGCVSVKAKTGEGLDAVGRGEAVTAMAIVLLISNQNSSA